MKNNSSSLQSNKQKFSAAAREQKVKDVESDCFHFLCSFLGFKRIAETENVVSWGMLQRTWSLFFLSIESASEDYPCTGFIKYIINTVG